MRKVRAVVSESHGELEFVPIMQLWAVSGVLADTFPLDRAAIRQPRWARRTAHWTRLVLVDRAVTDRDHTAVLTLSDTPWVPAVLVAVLAAIVAPRLPRWLRVLGFGGVAVWALRGGRASRFVAMRRELGDVAPGAVLVGDFVGLQPGAGMRWVADALDRLGHQFPFVALVPESGDPRRDAARERLYVRRLGFRRAGRTAAGGQAVAVLVRD
jgi:hypothetical protein